MKFISTFVLFFLCIFLSQGLFVDVTNFGAKGDGVFKNTAAIKAALKTCEVCVLVPVQSQALLMLGSKRVSAVFPRRTIRYWTVQPVKPYSTVSVSTGLLLLVFI